ncbi:hypothetical protein BJ166DRAFT_249574 [Pestalotiopsis sp. NC0098]|nr:hypothetical protein BJ166DRAFT_249574 [Pestalotiopsis sp. NC0098]
MEWYEIECVWSGRWQVGPPRALASTRLGRVLGRVRWPLELKPMSTRPLAADRLAVPYINPCPLPVLRRQGQSNCSRPITFTSSFPPRLPRLALPRRRCPGRLRKMRALLLEAMYLQHHRQPCEVHGPHGNALFFFLPLRRIYPAVRLIMFLQGSTVSRCLLYRRAHTLWAFLSRVVCIIGISIPHSSVCPFKAASLLDSPYIFQR